MPLDHVKIGGISVVGVVCEDVGEVVCEVIWIWWGWRGLLRPREPVTLFWWKWINYLWDVWCALGFPSSLSIMKTQPQITPDGWGGSVPQVGRTWAGSDPALTQLNLSFVDTLSTTEIHILTSREMEGLHMFNRVSLELNFALPPGRTCARSGSHLSQVGGMPVPRVANTHAFGMTDTLLCPVSR